MAKNHLTVSVKNHLTLTPPHIHAIYGEDMAAIDIQTGEVMEGHLPTKALAMVREWVSINKADLLHMWKTQEFKPLSSLE